MGICCHLFAFSTKCCRKYHRSMCESVGILCIESAWWRCPLTFPLSWIVRVGFTLEFLFRFRFCLFLLIFFRQYKFVFFFYCFTYRSAFIFHLRYIETVHFPWYYKRDKTTSIDIYLSINGCNIVNWIVYLMWTIWIRKYN